MKGIIQEGLDLRNASTEELRRTLTELIMEMRYRFSTISKENFDPQDLKELGQILMSDAQKPEDRRATIEIRDGKILLTGEVYINGEPYGG